MFKFLTAKHRWTYIWLAIKHFTTPGHVYDIAHGKSSDAKKDQNIRHDLLDRKIIFHHHHRHYNQ